MCACCDWCLIWDLYLIGWMFVLRSVCFVLVYFDMLCGFGKHRVLVLVGCLVYGLLVLVYLDDFCVCVVCGCF